MPSLSPRLKMLKHALPVPVAPMSSIWGNLRGGMRLSLDQERLG